MKQILILLTAMLLFSKKSNSQTAADSVKAVINQLFAAMLNADAAKLKETFADSAILQTIRKNKEGSFITETEKVSDFADFISTVKKDSADERITFESIKIDGPLAAVWAPYNFYYNGIFSHCGVDSFQLLRINGRWKIIYLIDTRRKQGCKPH